MPEFFIRIFSPEMLNILPTLPKEIWETLYSAVIATFFAYVIGLPLGILLATNEKGGVLPMPRPISALLDIIVNVLRSIPFLIFMIMVLPLSVILLGTRIGTIASLPPLILAAAPFVARLVEGSLREVDSGLIEAAQAMGCSPGQIIGKVMLPEARPSLINGATIALTTILGYGAMAGAIGGGGLGKVAINSGYYRGWQDVMLWAVLLLVLLVQIFQTLGTQWAARSDKRLTRKTRITKGSLKK